MKTNWDLTLLYTGIRDAAIAKDNGLIREKITAFTKKYRSRLTPEASLETIYEALIAYEDVVSIAATPKSELYFFLASNLDGRDAAIQAKKNLVSEEMVELRTNLIFFPLFLRELSETKRSEILSSPLFTNYKYFLTKIFEEAKHMLSEAEEKVLGMTGNASYTAWTDMTERALAKSEITFKGVRLPLPEALNRIADLPKNDREILRQETNTLFKNLAPLAEAEINAIFSYKKTVDKLRGFTEAWDETLLSYEIEPETLAALREAVIKNYGISHRFYKLKAKLLNLPELSYADRAAKVGEVAETFSFEESVTQFSKTLSKYDTELKNTLERFLDKGQIDVLPKNGKRGGAFCVSASKLPTFVMLNHTSSIRSFATFAHELGHAFHSELSKAQTTLNEGYPTSTAEVASTLFESLAFFDIVDGLKDEDKIIALHNRLNDTISTIFRQIACFEFEAEIHKAVRETGFVPHDAIATSMNKHMSAYLGDVVKLTLDDGYFFVNWGHIRRPFYVFSYAYGELISRYLANRVQKDPGFMQKVKEGFLMKGCSQSPRDIFLALGIDTRDPQFWNEAIQEIDRELIELEKMVKN